MVERFEVTIPALTGKKPRRAFVYLPTGYNEEERYPVMYMFDGHNLFDDGEATFGKSWGLEDYLDYTDTQVIIAAVECNHEGDKRLEEYSPVDFVCDGKKIRGRGAKYMKWLVSKFKPFIDKNYSTLTDRANTAIGGSSMGGLMTLYALSKFGKFFGKGAALSPSLWACGGVPDFIKEAKFGKETLLYTDYGSKEFSNHNGMKKLFAQTAETLIEKGVFVTSRIVPHGTHSEASWEKCIPYFMDVLFPDL